MAEITLRWPTPRSTPINPDWEEHTYSGSRAAAEAIVELGHTAYTGVTNVPITVETAREHIRIADAIKLERSQRAEEQTARDKTLAKRKLMALIEVLTCQNQGMWLDRVNRVPDVERARTILARKDARSLLAAMTEDADQLIAAYEGVS